LEMPFPNTYTRLKENTQACIVRGDDDPAAETESFGNRDGESVATLLHHDNGLWVELAFDIGGEG
jgi:hypothetical protein